MKTVYKSCLHCGARIESTDEDSCVMQYCDHCFEYKELRRRCKEGVDEIDSLKSRVTEERDRLQIELNHANWKRGLCDENQS